MKVKFDTFEKVNKFIKTTTSLESDVFVKSGKYVIDGKSVMGIYSLDLSKELEIEVVEKVNGETDKLLNALKELNVVTE